MSVAFEALCEALAGVTVPSVIYQSGPLHDDELAPLEAALGAPLPSEYRELLTTEGALYLTTPKTGEVDAALTDPDPRRHLTPGPAGIDYWFSFVKPAQSLRATSELRQTLREDIGDGALAARFEKAFIFQQGGSDSSYYLLVNDGGAVHFVGFGIDCRATNLLEHMRQYAATWRSRKRA